MLQAEFVKDQLETASVRVCRTCVRSSFYDTDAGHTPVIVHYANRRTRTN